jgi:hypothetical protein
MRPPGRFPYFSHIGGSQSEDSDMDLFLGSKTKREVSGDFQVDLQDQACCR